MSLVSGEKSKYVEPITRTLCPRSPYPARPHLDPAALESIAAHTIEVGQQGWPLDYDGNEEKEQ
ncbi:uncharacterized protein N0V89_000929 [Didymosphaeria variabile]|uniref:Uncharacterized protein n=1 Tax=Didymosphaeria variabile TaxID=1932322 RepID=A0A9W8XV70_9PLEO|nr:uncharacterized protein N0V89_000929 [Didymosphaeria variabile]KAJ4360367.1 hypothetical protein N0V89_000929 [Didymosphaeria variabile]